MWQAVSEVIYIMLYHLIIIRLLGRVIKYHGTYFMKE